MHHLYFIDLVSLTANAKFQDYRTTCSEDEEWLFGNNVYELIYIHMIRGRSRHHPVVSLTPSTKFQDYRTTCSEDEERLFGISVYKRIYIHMVRSRSRHHPVVNFLYKHKPFINMPHHSPIKYFQTRFLICINVQGTNYQ